MQAAKDVVDRLKELKINALHIKLRACGGIGMFLHSQVLTQDNLVQELNQPWEHLPVSAWRSVALKTLLPFPPIALVDPEVEEVADCDDTLIHP